MNTQNKRATNRPWGNKTYEELITDAILSSPEKRLVLSDIYKWFVSNIPYFAEPRPQSAWKNSVRHNLSIYTKFQKIVNDTAGQSSYWTINDEATNGKRFRTVNRRRKCQTAIHDEPIATKRCKLPEDTDSPNIETVTNVCEINGPETRMENGEVPKNSLDGQEKVVADSNLDKEMSIKIEPAEPETKMENEDATKNSSGSQEKVVTDSNLNQEMSIKTEPVEKQNDSLSFQNYIKMVEGLMAYTRDKLNAIKAAKNQE